MDWERGRRGGGGRKKEEKGGKVLGFEMGVGI